MSELTRTEHLAWCKRRALEYLDLGEPQTAITSMMSDLKKHPGTACSVDGLSALALWHAAQGGTESVRRFIEGFQ